MILSYLFYFFLPIVKLSDTIRKIIYQFMLLLSFSGSYIFVVSQNLIYATFKVGSLSVAALEWARCQDFSRDPVYRNVREP